MARKKFSNRMIFTDLDGTLLDRDTYDWKPAEPSLKLAKEKNVPVIFCTSKTRPEVEVWRRRLKNGHPFITENGGAIFIPEGYFSKNPAGSRKLKGYRVVALGASNVVLRKVLAEMKEKNLKVRGFGDMDLREVMKLTGLSKEDAILAKKREYDEPFLLEDKDQLPAVRGFVKKKGLGLVKGGRFYHLIGGNDKGLAIKLLSGFYGNEVGYPMIVAAIGDSQNDISMLRASHIPYLLKRKDGKHIKTSGNIILIDEPGPKGWNSAMSHFLMEEF